MEERKGAQVGLVNVVRGLWLCDVELSSKSEEGLVEPLVPHQVAQRLNFLVVLSFKKLGNVEHHLQKQTWDVLKIMSLSFPVFSSFLSIFFFSVLSLSLFLSLFLSLSFSLSLFLSLYTCCLPR